MLEGTASQYRPLCVTAGIGWEAEPMTDKVVQMFRRLTLLCLLGVGAIATLTYADLLNPKAATITVAVLAVLLFIFDTLSEAPDARPEPEGKVSRLMALKALADQTTDTQSEAESPDQSSLPPEAVGRLLEQNPHLLDLVNASGNQLYLLKLRDYLIRKIKAEYERTGLVNLVAELQRVEAELNVLEISYDPLAVPERLTELMESFDRQKRIQGYCNVIDALPFLPLKGLIKVYLRLRLR
jgi:hypothetical protein